MWFQHIFFFFLITRSIDTVTRRFVRRYQNVTVVSLYQYIHTWLTSTSHIPSYFYTEVLRTKDVFDVPLLILFDWYSGYDRYGFNTFFFFIDQVIDPMTRRFVRRYQNAIAVNLYQPYPIYFYSEVLRPRYVFDVPPLLIFFDWYIRYDLGSRFINIFLFFLSININRSTDLSIDRSIERPTDRSDDSSFFFRRYLSQFERVCSLLEERGVSPAILRQEAGRYIASYFMIRTLNFSIFYKKTSILLFRFCCFVIFFRFFFFASVEIKVSPSVCLCYYFRSDRRGGGQVQYPTLRSI